MIHRKNYLDALRGITIFLVVFIHVTRIPEIRTYISGFVLPIFFFISGVLFSPEKNKNFRHFFVKKIKSLLIPYCFFYLITFFYWLAVERNVRGGVSPGSQLLGLFYGTYNLKYMFFNGALWFLPCLFTTEILYFWICKIPKVWGRIFMLSVSFLLGILLLYNGISWLPWGANAALFACVFYGIGNCLKHKIGYIENRSLAYYIIIIAICSILQFILFDYNTLADLSSLSINYYFFIPMAIIGIMLFLSISLVIKKNKLLEFLGVNSLVIFAFQEQTYRAVIFLFVKFSGWEIELVRENFLISVLISVITILIITPLIFGYNKFIKPLLLK